MFFEEILDAAEVTEVTAEALALRIIRAERKSRDRYLADVAADGADVAVSPSPHAPADASADAAEIQEAARAMAAQARR